MLKKLKHRIALLWKLAAPITHERLMLLGFDCNHPYYMLTNLAIEVDIIKRVYYYVDENGNRQQIKTMRDISGLIYGPTMYAPI